ncbi:MAG: hypothetical protein HY607_04015 [Planctomycetes bacterium]|uniref:hypothetical protein n=1 Tax=Candidatus Wunengus californicus TaxID=3367619 RepID=UPI004028C88D|nr:hypothetical protein [Planctomycetota bacterium]
MNKYSEIADGLASWLTFELRAGREALFCESYLTYPLGQLLQYQYPGRVLSEVEHPILAEDKKGPGKKPRIDFVVTGQDEKYDVVIETKWVSKSPTLLRDIIRDIVRLDLLISNYAREALLVVAGQAKEFFALFENSQFKPHPNHLSSNHILPLGNHIRASVRFVPIPKFRSVLYSQVLSAFEGIEISKSIQLERSGPFPRNATTKHYEVYLWKIRRFSEAEKFKPEAQYVFGSSSK